MVYAQKEDNFHTTTISIHLQVTTQGPFLYQGSIIFRHLEFHSLVLFGYRYGKRLVGHMESRKIPDSAAAICRNTAVIMTRQYRLASAKGADGSGQYSGRADLGEAQQEGTLKTRQEKSSNHV